jgi:hypothetical protein
MGDEQKYFPKKIREKKRIKKRHSYYFAMVVASFAVRTETMEAIRRRNSYARR